jgi:hypothetical protein
MPRDYFSGVEDRLWPKTTFKVVQGQNGQFVECYANGIRFAIIGGLCDDNPHYVGPPTSAPELRVSSNYLRGTGNGGACVNVDFGPLPSVDIRFSPVAN